MSGAETLVLKRLRPNAWQLKKCRRTNLVVELDKKHRYFAIYDASTIGGGQTQ